MRASACRRTISLMLEFLDLRQDLHIDIPEFRKCWE